MKGFHERPKSQFVFAAVKRCSDFFSLFVRVFFFCVSGGNQRGFVL